MCYSAPLISWGDSKRKMVRMMSGSPMRVKWSANSSFNTRPGLLCKKTSQCVSHFYSQRTPYSLLRFLTSIHSGPQQDGEDIKHNPAPQQGESQRHAPGIRQRRVVAKSRLTYPQGQDAAGREDCCGDHPRKDPPEAYGARPDACPRAPPMPTSVAPRAPSRAPLMCAGGAPDDVLGLWRSSWPAGRDEECRTEAIVSEQATDRPQQRRTSA